MNNLLPPIDELNDIKKFKEKLCGIFGNEFGYEYGWAANIITNPHKHEEKLKNPTFSNIEESVGLDHLRPYYKMANISIHAGSKGIKFHLTSPNKNVIPAGPSNMGMADPGQLSAISLFQINMILLSTRPSIRYNADSSALKMLLDEIKKSFAKVHHLTLNKYQELLDEKGLEE